MAAYIHRVSDMEKSCPMARVDSMHYRLLLSVPEDGGEWKNWYRRVSNLRLRCV